MTKDRFIKVYQDKNFLPADAKAYAEFLTECAKQGYAVQSYGFHPNTLICAEATGTLMFKVVDMDLFPYTVFTGFDAEPFKEALEFAFKAEQCTLTVRVKGNLTVQVQEPDELLGWYYELGLNKKGPMVKGVARR
jgi:hypothetical protein